MPETRHVEIGDLTLGNDWPLILIAGPCVLESRAHALEMRRAQAVLAADTYGPSAAGHVRITFAVAEAKLAEACERIAEFVAEIGRGQGKRTLLGSFGGFVWCGISKRTLETKRVTSEINREPDLRACIEIS